MVRSVAALLVECDAFYRPLPCGCPRLCSRPMDRRDRIPQVCGRVISARIFLPYNSHVQFIVYGIKYTRRFSPPANFLPQAASRPQPLLYICPSNALVTETTRAAVALRRRNHLFPAATQPPPAIIRTRSRRERVGGCVPRVREAYGHSHGV